MSQKIKTVKQYVALQKPSGVDWDNSGMLDRLSFEDSVVIKERLEEMSRLIISGVFLKNKGTETVIFPIVRVTYTRHNYLIKDCLKTLLYVDSRLETLEIEIENLMKKAYNTIDVEAEFTSLLCEEIANLKL